MSSQEPVPRLRRIKKSCKRVIHSIWPKHRSFNPSISNSPTAAISPHSASVAQAHKATDTHNTAPHPTTVFQTLLPDQPSHFHSIPSSTSQDRDADPDIDPLIVQPESGPVPPEVKADILLVYNGDSYTDLKNQTIRWMGRAQYKYFDSEAIRTLRKHRKDLEFKQLYRKTGLCRLIRNDNQHEEDTEILESEQHWSEKIPLLVVRFCSKNPYVEFHLAIRWDYSDLSIHKVEDEEYAHTVRRAVQDKHQTNWQQETYIPRKDLDEIFSEGTIKELINSDKSLEELSQKSTNGELSFDKTEFTDRVIHWATRLLALCVHSHLPLSCLYHLMDAGKKDTDLPLTALNCPDSTYKSGFQDLIMNQWLFIAHRYTYEDRRPKHEKLDLKVIVPIISADAVAEGGFGKVFKVYIDPDHHFFCSDRNAPFALKRFFQLGSRTEEDFSREERMLQALSQFPHDHITPHLASWTQRETFYMLFPLAEMNLGRFLRKMPHPELENEFVLWLFSQLKGVAAAVCLIHNLGPSGLGPESLVRTLPAAKKPGRTGFHHDIKPENILVFAKTDTENKSFKITDCVLKISDFGAARINVILSQSLSGARRITSFKMQNFPLGDSVWGAPDYALEGHASRPYDLWSLGCVFLEVLIWTFGLSNSDLDNFANDRLHSRGAPMNSDSAFWHKDRDGKIRLKAAVVQRLKQHQRHCRNRGVFEHLVRSTGRLLTILPSKRSKAQDICTELDAALLQLQVDLEKPGFYRDDIDEYRAVAAPPTMVSNEASRRPSIDESSIYAHEDRLLHPHTEVKRRSTQPTSKRDSEVTRHEHSTSESITARDDLSSIVTQDLPAGPSHSHSPSISISHVDDPFTSIAIDDDDVQPFPPVGSHQYQPGLEDWVPRRRGQSSDSRSLSLP